MHPSASYYEASATRGEPWAALRGRHDARVAIVGAGFAGLATALGLVERGVRDVALLEAGRIAQGASGRNGGFVFGGYSLDGDAVARRLGKQAARELHALTLDAVALIRRRIDAFGIDAQPVDAGALWVNWFDDEGLLRRAQQALREGFGVDWPLIGRDELRAHHVRSQRYHGALFEPGGFHFHPLRYALGLARVLGERGVRLHEDSAVVAIERQGGGFIVRTQGGAVAAEQVVVAGGGMLKGVVPELERAMLPIATYIVATEPLGTRLDELLPSHSAIYDSRFAFDYYRRLPDTRLLWGGRISIRQRAPQAISRLLAGDIAKVFPTLRGVKIEHAWGGLMSYARHKMPQIGRLAAGPRAGLWHALGFGGHGVAPTTVAGEALAAAIAGERPLHAGFAAYGLPRVWGPAGLLAAQASYGWAQLADAWKAR